MARRFKNEMTNNAYQQLMKAYEDKTSSLFDSNTGEPRRRNILADYFWNGYYNVGMKPSRSWVTYGAWRAGVDSRRKEWNEEANEQPHVQS